MTKTIEPGVAEVLHDLENGEVEGDWTRLADLRGDSGRWQEHRTLVIQHADGTVWGIGYSVGLTENQDHTMPWRDSKDRPIELERLYAHTVTKTTYRSTPPAVEPEPAGKPKPDEPADYISVDAFAGKVEWEGGIVDALDYGLKHTDLDPNQPDSAKLREAWARLERLYEPVRAQKEIVSDLLDEIDAADEDGG